MTPDPNALPDDVIAAIRQGNKIEAIKLLRAKTGLDLKGAKDLVDAAEPRYRPVPAPGEVPRSKGALWWIVAVAIVAVAAYYFLRK